MEKLHPQRNDLWQKPKGVIKDANSSWYENVPVGRDTLNDFMKQLSKKADLSRIYTNHCIRATTVTNLNELGFEARDIMATTGHKSESSIRSYASKCPDNKRRQMSDALAESLQIKKTKKPEIKEEPQEPQPSTSTENQNSFGIDEVEISDTEIINILTQIEKETEEIAAKQQKTAGPNQQEIDKEPTKTNDTPSINTVEKVPPPPNPQNTNVMNVSNVSTMQNRILPPMYFPHSSVTINYNIIQK